VQTGDWHSTAVKQAPMFVIPAWWEECPVLN
jgi:hypothetical protein